MKVYMTSDSSSGGKFWEIETDGKSFTTRYGRANTQGRTTNPKKFGSKAECEEQAEKLIQTKKKKGYSEKKNKKRKQPAYSSDENEESSEEAPPPKKQKTTNKRPKRSKRRKKESSSEEESESEDSEVFDSAQDKENEKKLRKMLKDSSVLLKDANDQKKFEIVVEGKTYIVAQGKIGTKGRQKTKKFNSKKKAFESALDLLSAKMRDDWSIVESENESENESEESKEEKPGIFDPYKFVISGAFLSGQKKMKALIEGNGGTVKSSVSENVDFVLVRAKGYDLESTKCNQAMKQGIPIVSADYLHKSIEKGAKLDHKDFIVEEEEAGEEGSDSDVPMTDKTKKKKKVSRKKQLSDSESDTGDNSANKNKKSEKKVVKFTGSAPVDELYENGVDGYSVYEENGVVYDAMLNQTNVGRNNNKFYKLQVLQDESGGFNAWFRWGRVGYKGKGSNASGTKQKCIAMFTKKFHDKTLNDWQDRDDFEAHAKKYTYIKMDYGNGSDCEEEEESGGEEKEDMKSELHKNIQELVKLIFNKEMMEEQMKEIGYDAEKLPLGKLDKSVIKRAYKILQQIEGEINKGNKGESEEESDGNDNDSDSGKRRSKRMKKKSSRKVGKTDALEEFTNQYYTLIPHEFGMGRAPIINSEKMLNKEMKLIEALGEIEVATRLIAGGKGKNKGKHVCDRNFDLLKCDMDVIDKSTDEFEMLADYVKLTHAATHNRFKLKVERAYKLDRFGSNDRFKPWEGNHNRMLLWHGSRLTNFVGIISQGLRIAPPEAPVTGYMFGKGVYFADMCSKSANYCFTSPNNSTGLILLCEVALGDMNELTHADCYAAELPDGKSSTKGCGRTIPDNSTYQTLDNGCVVPMGKSKSNPSLNSSLLYNEYIVYDTAQIKMKYLLKLDFDYGSNSGW